MAYLTWCKTRPEIGDVVKMAGLNEKKHTLCVVSRVRQDLEESLFNVQVFCYGCMLNHWFSWNAAEGDRRGRVVE